MALFTEPFAWLKNIGDAVGQASEAVRPLNDWNGLGSIGWKPNGGLGELTYQAPNSQRIEQRQSAASMPTQRQSIDPTANISRIFGLDEEPYDPYPSRGYSTEGSKQLNDPTMGVDISPEEMRAQKIQALMDELQMGTENAGMVDEAFAGSLAAIEKARGSAQNNFKESDSAIQGLTQGHVNEIKTVDRRAVEDNAKQFSGELTNTYDGAKNTIAADQKAELSARAEMLSRLGIQEAGLGNAGQAQSQAMTRLTEDKGAQLGRASTYKAADLTRNTEMAAAQATEGVERRSDLRRQLDGINADLDRDTASVENSKAQARLAGTNADKEAYLKQLEFYSNELKNLEESKTAREDKAYDRALTEREFALKSAPKNVGGALDIADQQVRALGEDPTQYSDAYAQTAQENAYDSRSGKDKIYETVATMTKKNPRLNPKVALRYVMSIENFGTDKGNTPIQ